MVTLRSMLITDTKICCGRHRSRYLKKISKNGAKRPKNLLLHSRLIQIKSFDSVTVPYTTCSHVMAAVNI